MKILRTIGLLGAVGLGLSQGANATDFSGHWQGTGTLTEKNPFTGAKVSPCAKVELVLEHLPTRLTIAHYHAICGMIDSDWGPALMEIHEGKVYEDGEETGTFAGDTLLTLDRSGSMQYAFNLRLREPEAGQPRLLETYYGVRNAMGSMVIEGKLPAVTP